MKVLYGIRTSCTSPISTKSFFHKSYPKYCQPIKLKNFVISNISSRQIILILGMFFIHPRKEGFELTGMSLTMTISLFVGKYPFSHSYTLLYTLSYYTLKENRTLVDCKQKRTVNKSSFSQ